MESGFAKVKGCAKSVQVVQIDFMCLTKRFNAITVKLNDITFQSFAKGKKVSNRNAASEIFSEFNYVCSRL